MNIADSEAEAQRGINEYITQYYPELSKAVDLSEWGPVGTPDQIGRWIAEFAQAGVDVLHLQVWRARPVWPGDTVCQGRAAQVRGRGPALTGGMGDGGIDIDVAARRRP